MNPRASQISQNNLPNNFLQNFPVMNPSQMPSNLENNIQRESDIKAAKERFYALKSKKNKRHFQVIYMFKNK